jgi:hypothetical protein
LALDDVRLLLPLDCELRLERLEPAFEREPALLEPELFDFSPDFADREPEVAWRSVFRVAIPEATASKPLRRGASPWRPALPQEPQAVRPDRSSN